MLSDIELTVNGELRRLHVDDTTMLLDVLRTHLDLKAARFGCGAGQCGTCAVIVDGEAVFSCLTPIAILAGRQVLTIEGLGTADHPGPMQQAFIAEQAAQCGYCIAGMVMRAQALLAHTPKPTEQEIRDGMNPNLCRCGTHMRILAAVRRAAGKVPAKAAAR